MNLSTIDLLNRAYTELHKSKLPKKVFVRPEIIIHNRKSYITNYISLCESLDRDVEHFRKFIETEMSTDTAIIKENNLDDSDGTGLKLNGMFRSNQILDMITNYIKTFVLCDLCKSGHTKLIKIDRITYISCNSCKSNKAI
jgi:translation initiation factor 2 beta subunit (eIF-2beta)/eIF-5